MTIRHWVSIGLIAALVAAIAPLVALGGFGSTLLARTILDLGHLPLFAFVATLLLLLAAQWVGDRWSLAAQYLGVLAAALAIGLGTEWIQMLGPRDADMSDLVRNGMGAVLGLAWWATFDRRLDAAPVRRGVGRVVVRSVVIVAVVAFATPLLGTAKAYRERDHRFPVLFSFATASERSFLKTRLAWYEFTTPPERWTAAPPHHVAHVSFSPLSGGALVFDEPYPDWTGHSALVFEFFVPGERAIDIGLRIEDRVRSKLYVDRFHRRLSLQPGFNRSRIPLEEIVHGPADRDLDISSIASFVLFASDPAGGYEIYLGRVVLEPGPAATSSKSPG